MKVVATLKSQNSLFLKQKNVTCLLTYCTDKIRGLAAPSRGASILMRIFFTLEKLCTKIVLDSRLL